MEQESQALIFYSLRFFCFENSSKEELDYLALSVASYLQSKVIDCLFINCIRNIFDGCIFYVTCSS